MSDEPKLCQKQDSCPLLLEALHQKVTAESNMRLARSAAAEAETAFATKRTLFNEFYKLAVQCRTAQARYFAERTQTALVDSKQAERRLDAHIAMLAKSSSRDVHHQPDFNFAEVANA